MSLLLVVAAPAQQGNAAHPFSANPQLTLWFGGGPSVPTASVSFRSLGFAALRYTVPMHFWGLGDHNGFLDGFWEYQTEITAWAIFQNHSAVAIGYTPIGFRYLMRAHDRIRPFVGGLAGMLFASSPIPAGASRFNFTPQAEFGLEIGRRAHHFWSMEVRYAHISNAGISHPNPGINSVLVLAGYTF